jgi:hypothetical protein
MTMARIDGRPMAHPYQPAQHYEAGCESPNAIIAEYKRNPWYSTNEWLWEALSSILALGLLVAITLIFCYMDNKPLSVWSAPISLSATIATLATGYTTSLMYGVSIFIGQAKWLHFKRKSRKLAEFEIFDEASRGVWGSLQLLKLGLNLATMGALITILRLSFSPFAQEVILLKQRDVKSASDNATFGYAHGYVRNLAGYLANSAVRECPNNHATSKQGLRLTCSRLEAYPQDSGLQAAIIQGLYGISVAEPFTCPGRCSWTGSYISVGFKVECKNVTQETLRTATCSGKEPSLHQCNMTTPSGIDIKTRDWSTDLATAYYMNVSSPLPSSQTTTFPADTLPGLAHFAVYRSTPNFSFQMLDVNITECSLSLTAYEYTDAQANGSEFSFASRREVDFGVKNPWAYNETGDTDDLLVTKETMNGDTRIPALALGSASLIALENFFLSSSIVTEWVQGNYPNTNLGVSAALMGDVDIGERFNNMATAMTNYLRYGPNTQSAKGDVVQSEAFVSIRWVYFIVPIVIEGLAILFAILSIFLNRQSRCVPLWKSSALAVLACQHDEQVGILYATGKDVDEIKEEAKETKAKLR